MVMAQQRPTVGPRLSPGAAYDFQTVRMAAFRNLTPETQP